MSNKSRSASRETLQARRELLQMRAALERLEAVEQMRDLRQALSPSALVRHAAQALWPSFGGRIRPSEKGLQLALSLLRRYPLISSAVSLVAVKKGLASAVRAAKWTGLAWAGWSVYRRWQALKDPGLSTRRRPGA
jgi:hypothetical protein